MAFRTSHTFQSAHARTVLQEFFVVNTIFPLTYFLSGSMLSKVEEMQMGEKLYIVVYRDKNNGRWKSMSEGEFTDRRLAENLIECKRSTGWLTEYWDFAIVEGPIQEV